MKTYITKERLHAFGWFAGLYVVSVVLIGGADTILHWLTGLLM